MTPAGRKGVRMGSLYRPKLRGLGYSRIWWCKYYVDGRPIRESTGIASDTETAPAEARRFLKVREGAVATGQPVLPRVDRIRYEELAADLRRYYQTTGKRRMKEAETRLRRLDKFFVGYRVAAISPSTISAFVEGRQKENAANATINREPGTLRLDPGMTKNDEGRIVYLTPELKALLATQLNRVETLQRRTGKIIPYLFPHLSGRRAGARRRDFRKAWTTACEKAGVAGRIRHDFRRTAVRNMVNAGVPERVAMKVTGHKTRAVFDRYHIVSPGDLQDVATKLTAAITRSRT